MRQGAAVEGVQPTGEDKHFLEQMGWMLASANGTTELGGAGTSGKGTRPDLFSLSRESPGVCFGHSHQRTVLLEASPTTHFSPEEMWAEVALEGEQQAGEGLWM